MLQERNHVFTMQRPQQRHLYKIMAIIMSLFIQTLLLLIWVNKTHQRKPDTQTYIVIALHEKLYSVYKCIQYQHNTPLQLFWFF